MNRKLEFLRRLVRFFDEYSVSVLVIYVAGIVVAKETPGIGLILTVAGCYLLSYLIRERLPYIWITLLHLLLGGLCALIPGSFFARCMPALIILAHILPSALAYARRGATLKPVDEAPWPLLLICVVADIYGFAVKSPLLMMIAYIVLLILLADYLICLYLDGASKYIKSNRDVSGLPIKRMLQVNAILIAGILAVIALFIFLTRNVDFTVQFKALLALLLLVVKAIAAALVTFVILVITFFGSFADTDGLREVRNNLVQEEELSKASELWDILLGIIFFVIIVFLSYKLITFLLKLFLKKRRFATDVVETVEREEESFVEEVSQKKGFFGRMSKKERARRIYKARVLMYKNQIRLTPQKTCRDLEDELLERELDDVGALTDLYENIRYGDLEVTREVLREMNKI